MVNESELATAKYCIQTASGMRVSVEYGLVLMGLTTAAVAWQNSLFVSSDAKLGLQVSAEARLQRNSWHTNCGKLPIKCATMYYLTDPRLSDERSNTKVPSFKLHFLHK